MTESPSTSPPPDPGHSSQSEQSDHSGQSDRSGQSGPSGGSTLSEFRRLRRAKEGRVVGGVCAGLGRDLRIDPVILRVLLAVMVFFGGAGLLIYGAAWLLIPEEGDDQRSILERQLGRRPNGQPDKAVVIGGVVVLFLLIASVPWWGFSWHPAALLLLAGAGLYFLLRRASGSQPGDGFGATPPGPPDGSTGGIGSWLGGQQRTSGPAGAGTQGGPMPPGMSAPGVPGPYGPYGPYAAPGAPGAPGFATSGPPPAEPTVPLAPEPAPTGSWRDFRPLPPEFWNQPDPLGLESDGPPAQPGPPVAYGPAPPPAPRPRSRLFWVTSAFALIVLGVMALVDIGAPSIPVAAYVAAPLAVVGLGLIAGAWWGRSPGLVVVGVLLSLSLVPISVGDYVNDAGAGTVTYRPMSVSEIRPSYDYGAGEFVLDLRDANFTAGHVVATSIDCGACGVRVLLPPEVDATLTADVALGDMQLFPPMTRGTDGLPVPPKRPEPPAPLDESGRPEGREFDGVDDQVRTTDYGIDGPGGGKLKLNVDLGVGNLEVVRVG